MICLKNLASCDVLPTLTPQYIKFQQGNRLEYSQGSLGSRLINSWLHQNGLSSQSNLRRSRRSSGLLGDWATCRIWNQLMSVTMVLQEPFYKWAKITKDCRYWGSSWLLLAIAWIGGWLQVQKPPILVLSHCDTSQAKVGLSTASSKPEGWHITLPLHDTRTLMSSCPCRRLLATEGFRRGLQFACAQAEERNKGPKRKCLLPWMMVQWNTGSHRTTGEEW